jgi:two-component system nitrate/nitrite response regulator NarL
MPFERLSPRERQVLRALCDGKSVTAIATVRAQVRAVLAKLGAGSQLEAVAEANRCGWYAEPHPTELHLHQA